MVRRYQAGPGGRHRRRIGRVGAVRQGDRLPRAGGAAVAVVGGADLPAVGATGGRAGMAPGLGPARQGNPTVQARTVGVAVTGPRALVAQSTRAGAAQVTQGVMRITCPGGGSSGGQEPSPDPQTNLTLGAPAPTRNQAGRSRSRGGGCARNRSLNCPRPPRSKGDHGSRAMLMTLRPPIGCRRRCRRRRNRSAPLACGLPSRLTVARCPRWPSVRGRNPDRSDRVPPCHQSLAPDGATSAVHAEPTTRSPRRTVPVPVTPAATSVRPSWYQSAFHTV